MFSINIDQLEYSRRINSYVQVMSHEAVFGQVTSIVRQPCENHVESSNCKSDILFLFVEEADRKLV